MASHKEGKKNKNFPRPLYRLRKRGQTSAAMSGEFTPADIGAHAWRRVYSPRMRFAVRPSLWQAIKRVKNKKNENFPPPSLPLAEERADERSDVG